MLRCCHDTGLFIFNQEISFYINCFTIFEGTQPFNEGVVDM